MGVNKTIIRQFVQANVGAENACPQQLGLTNKKFSLELWGTPHLQFFST